jgi:hypothetical protein
MRAVKFAKRRAVAGRAFREKQHGAAREHSLRHCGVGAGDCPSPFAIHENGFLQPRESGDDRPGFDFTLGEETDGLDAAKHHYVEPRKMICDNQKRPLRRRGALRDDIQAKQGGERSAEGDREPQT